MTAKREALIQNRDILKLQEEIIVVEKIKPSSEIIKHTSKDPPKTEHNFIINILNLLGYALNILMAYLGDVSRLFVGKSNNELSYQYQTLITPGSVYFGYIWGLIFLSQGFFVAAQLLPKYKDHILVQRGVGFWYFFACIAQAGWVVSFGYELIITAFVCMVAILLCLITILSRQWRVIEEIDRKTERDPWLLANNAISVFEEDEEEFIASPPTCAYWLLRFPFAVHAGWIALATPLMLSVMLVSYNVGMQVELWTAVLGIAILFGTSMGLLLRQDKGTPSYIFPFVVAYACTGIAWELNAPSDDILGSFQDGEIRLMKNVAGFCGAMLLAAIVSRFFAVLIRKHCCPRKYKDGEDDNAKYVKAEDV
jgi:hypothetical protein